MPWQPPRRDKGRTLALVAGLHLLLGFALVRGLAVDTVAKAGEALAAIDISLPPPEKQPEPPPPPPDEAAPAAAEEEGARDLQAEAAATVLPPPPQPLPTRNPLAVADEPSPGAGNAPSAGASAETGSGRGAGDAGSGTGGGGTGGAGAGSGGGLGQEARLLAGNLTRRDYRRIRDFGSPRGSAVLAIEVSAAGRLTRCLPAVSSGNPALDAELCSLLQRTRWEPARDLSGRPVAVALRYVANWDRN